MHNIMMSLHRGVLYWMRRLASRCALCLIACASIIIMCLLLIYYNYKINKNNSNRYTLFYSGSLTCSFDKQSGKAKVLAEDNSGAIGWSPVIDFDADSMRGGSVRIREGHTHSETSSENSQINTEDLPVLLKQRGYQAVKLTPARSGYLVVCAKIEGKALRLLVDTGAVSSFLDTQRTESLGLKWQTYNVGHGDPESKSGETQKFAIAPTVEIGPFRLRGFTFTSHDLSNLNKRINMYGDEPFDGILGAEFFKSRSAIIDYEQGLMYLHGISPAVRGAGAVSEGEKGAKRAKRGRKGDIAKSL